MKKIAPINRAIRKKRIAAYDVETWGDELNTFRMGSIKYDNNFYVYWDKKDMERSLTKSYMNKFMVWATNLQFDWNVLYSLNEDWELLFNGSRLIKAYFRPHYVNHYDTLNIAPLSVKKMGELLGLPKLPSPRDFSKISDDELLEYNLRDTNITYNFMLWFQEEINRLGGELKATLPSVGMDIFRRKYLIDPIYQPIWLRNQRSYQSYYGGRTECFKKGLIENFYIYDINSMYPFVMLRPFPNVNKLKYKEKEIEYVMEYPGCSKVKLDIPPMYIPPIPYRYNNRLLFPCGILEGVWTNYEIQYAVNECDCKLLEVEWSIFSYDEMDYFSDFIIDLYQQRKRYKEKGLSVEYVVKILMNSVYGKFGTRIDKKGSGILKKIHYDTPLKELEGVMLYDDLYYIQKLEDIPAYVIPLIASYVTSMSRVLLHRYISSINNYYSDTDCLFTPDRLDISSELGDLKLEHEVEKGWLFGNKMYYLITAEGSKIIKCKGIPRNELELFYDDLFNKLDRKMTLHYKKFVKTKEAFRRKFLPNQVIDYKKTVNLYGFDKRRWLDPRFDIFTENTDTEPYFIRNGAIDETMINYI